MIKDGEVRVRIEILGESDKTPELEESTATGSVPPPPLTTKKPETVEVTKTAKPDDYASGSTGKPK